MGQNASSHAVGGSPPPAELPPPLNQKPPRPPSPQVPQTPLLLPYAGHLSPQNPHALSHPQVHDYSKEVVTALILDSQLAPFYRGLDDFEEDWVEGDILRVLDEVRSNDLDEDVDNSHTRRLKAWRDAHKPWGSAQERKERTRREGKAYLGAIECPICFLNYPPNINTSRCCQQPLCTECFVQIKRGDATTTHLESEPACCPYCVEVDFGVIYERPTVPPPTPMGGMLVGSPNALATSPDAAASGFSSALSLGDAGSPSATPAWPTPSATPKPETVRRKSVSSKAKEVITIDQIRPDWEAKLNAVKAAAARRASRRIVMRQVGDRLIPVGYTSSRAGQADFSMSIPPEEGGGRHRRRTREREQQMEELMIMEAMRLSLLDHEEHQRKANEERKKKDAERGGGGGPTTAGAAGPSSSAAAAGLSTATASGTAPTPPQRQRTNPSSESSSRRSSGAANTLASWRAASENGGGGRAQAAASKLLNKITVNRSRANSKSSVHFAPSPGAVGSPGTPPSGTSSAGPPSIIAPTAVGGASGSRARSSSTPSPNPMAADHQPSPLGVAAPTTRRSLDVTPRVLADVLDNSPALPDNANGRVQTPVLSVSPPESLPSNSPRGTSAAVSDRPPSSLSFGEGSQGQDVSTEGSVGSVAPAEGVSGLSEAPSQVPLLASTSALAITTQGSTSSFSAPQAAGYQPLESPVDIDSTSASAYLTMPGQPRSSSDLIDLATPVAERPTVTHATAGRAGPGPADRTAAESIIAAGIADATGDEPPRHM